MKKPTLIFIPCLLALMLTPLTAGSVGPSAKENKVFRYYGHEEPSTEKSVTPASETEKVPDGVQLVSNAARRSTGGYVIKKGDTLTKISKSTGVSVEKLMKLNGLKSNTLQAGKTLTTTAPTTVKPAPTKAITPAKPTEQPVTKPAANKLYYVKHEVKRGETVAQLARKYEVSPESILIANNLPEDGGLIPGRTVSVPVRGSSSKLVSKSTENTKTTTTKQAYEVEEKDTFYKLSVKYGISVEELKAANPGVNPDRLRPGTVLKIPVRATRKDVPISKNIEEKEKEKEKPEAPTAPEFGYPAKDLHSKNVTPIHGPAKEKEGKIFERELTYEEPTGLDRYFDYTIEPTETWDSIGAQFQVTGAEIRRINGVKAGEEAVPGSTISVPRTRVGVRPAARSAKQAI